MKEINISDKGDIKEIEKKEVKKEEKVTSKPQKLEKKEEVRKKEVPKKDPLKKKVENTKGSIAKKKGVLILSGIGLILLIGIAAFYYFGIYKYNPKPKDDNVVTVTNNYITTKLHPKIFAHLLVDTPQEPRTEESPINGLLFTKGEMDALTSRRPVAVMVSNHVQARPQSSLGSADIVYESLVESGITRYMAIYWSQGPQKVGSVRSARQYYLEWLSPYDPIYIHDGCADTDNPKTDACGNIYAYSIKDISTIGSWRWNDGVRYAPHNEYNSVLSAWDYAESRSWDSFPSNFESWQFKNDAQNNQRGDAYRYEIVFHNRLRNSGLYDAIWQYENTTNSYRRWIGGKVDIDQETNTQITAKVVVVQETNITSAYDNKGRIIVTTIGQGDAVILMDGKEIEGTWKKSNRTDRTTYYDINGDEIKFNRGRIWISIISQSLGEFDIIEQ